MAAYKTPDVYVKEISIFPPSVAEVATAIPAFIGYTEKAKKVKKAEKDDLKLKPHRITSMAEYQQFFGQVKIEPLGIDLVEDKKTGNIDIKPIASPPTLTYLMFYSLKMYFANGGGPCYIVSVGNYDDPIAKGNEDSGLLGGLKALEKEDEPTLIIFPDAVSLGRSGVRAN